jgi:hypothetical protein
MRRLLIIVITAVISIFASLVPIALASRASSFDLIGEVKAEVSVPPGLREHHRSSNPVQAIVPVTITSEVGGVVLREMVFTNTKLALWVPTGRYRVSAEIGPPTVNPKPRQCQSTRLVVAKGRQASFNLVCPLR